MKKNIALIGFCISLLSTLPLNLMAASKDTRVSPADWKSLKKPYKSLTRNEFQAALSQMENVNVQEFGEMTRLGTMQSSIIKMVSLIEVSNGNGALNIKSCELDDPYAITKTQSFNAFFEDTPGEKYQDEDVIIDCTGGSYTFGQLGEQLQAKVQCQDGGFRMMYFSPASHHYLKSEIHASETAAMPAAAIAKHCGDITQYYDKGADTPRLASTDVDVKTQYESGEFFALQTSIQGSIPGTRRSILTAEAVTGVPHPMEYMSGFYTTADYFSNITKATKALTVYRLDVQLLEADHFVGEIAMMNTHDRDQKKLIFNLDLNLE